MRVAPHRRHSLPLAVSLLLALAAADAAADGPAAPAPGSSPAHPRFRVRLGGLAGAALQRTLPGAARRLEQAGCQAVLDDFADAWDFRPGQRLEDLHVSPSEYLGLVVFADGAGRPLCRHAEVLAVTAPGSRVVYVCAARFAEAATRDPESAEALLIHEALHTLGLRENPPGSREITRRVLARCGDAVATAGASPLR